MSARNSFIGSPVERIEDLRFLRGRGSYVDDLTRDGLLHAVIQRSSIAHGRIRSIDARAARRLRGVHAVFTAADVGTPPPRIPLRLEPRPELARFEQPVLAHEKVRYVGEPMAVVIADSVAVAEDALEAIAVDIESLPAVCDWRESAKADVLLVEEAGTNLAFMLNGIKGDADTAFASVDYTRREHFHIQRHTAVPMEPRGLLAEWDAQRGRLTLFGAAKAPFAIRALLARQLQLPEDAIDVMESDIGAGFGVRGEFYPEDFLIPYAARRLDRPVKWIEDRREHLLATNHARELDCDLEIACRKDGTILAMRGHAYPNMGAYARTNAMTAPRNLAQVMTGPYRVPNVRMDVSMLMTNKTPTGSYRGPGRFEIDFARERLIDMAAAELGIDRVEFRRRNLVSEAEMPYAPAAIMPYGSETEYDSGDYQITLDRCLAEIGWDHKAPRQGRLIDGRYHGLGIACYVESGASGPKENARLVLESDGTVSVFVGSSAIGQGLETVFAQIAADALEIPMDRIRGVFHGSTTFVSEGFGSYASRAVVMGGSAILAAAANLRDAIRAAAAKQWDCAADDVEIVEGETARGPNGATLTLASLAAEPISADGTFLNNKRTYCYGAHAAHVAVDPRTGHVQLLDYVAVEDVGRIINPATLHGQIVGGIVQGLGGSFLEELVYDAQGQLLTGSLADYFLPTAGDFPNIRAIAMELKPSPNNPLGAKGAGEGGIIPVGGVIGNAVAAALVSLGVEPRDLPLSPPRLWQMIENARRAATPSATEA